MLAILLIRELLQAEKLSKEKDGHCHPLPSQILSLSPHKPTRLCGSGDLRNRYRFRQGNCFLSLYSLIYLFLFSVSNLMGYTSGATSEKGKYDTCSSCGSKITLRAPVLGIFS